MTALNILCYSIQRNEHSGCADHFDAQAPIPTKRIQDSTWHSRGKAFPDSLARKVLGY